jgi:type IV secretion system protein TrbG
MTLLPLMPVISIVALALGGSPTVPPSPRKATPAAVPGTKPPVSAATKAATLEPTSSSFVEATAVFAFADGAVYHVYTAPERVTDIVLQPGEQLGSVAAGDTARWVIGDTTSGAGADKRAHVLVKPFSAGLLTNLVITTDRRTYHLLVSSASGGAMSAMSWTYPQDALIAFRKVQADAAVAAPVSSGLDLGQLRFDYTITGDRPAWRPIRAFDDGRQTYIEFPADLAVGEAPPLFLTGADGQSLLVNYRQRGRFYVVDRLFDAAELRLGTKHQQIVRIIRSAAPRSGRKG